MSCDGKEAHKVVKVDGAQRDPMLVLRHTWQRLRIGMQRWMTLCVLSRRRGSCTSVRKNKKKKGARKNDCVRGMDENQYTIGTHVWRQDLCYVVVLVVMGVYDAVWFTNYVPCGRFWVNHVLWWWTMLYVDAFGCSMLLLLVGLLRKCCQNLNPYISF